MLVYEDLGKGLIKVKSDSGKYVNEHPTEIVDFYTEAVNKGVINNKGIGVFANGNTYTESEKDIVVERVEYDREN